MVNIETIEEYYATNVLLEMGNNLVKEMALAEYTMEAAQPVNIIRRAADFFSRVITRFIGWIRKGQLTRAKKRLEKMKTNSRYTNTHTPAGEEHMSTVFWDMTWLNKNVIGVLHDFNNSQLVKMITDGHVKTLYDRNVAGHVTAANQYRDRLHRSYQRMTSNSVRMIPVAQNLKILDQIIDGIINYAINDVYDNLVKSRDAIRVIRDTELDEKQLQDSRNMAQQYAHVMTILGNCFVEEMRIIQTIANVLINGARQQASPLLSRNDQRRPIIDNLTLNRFFEELDNVFTQKPASRNGIDAIIRDEDKNDNSKCRIELYWNDNNRIVRWYISCNKIQSAVKTFINQHAQSGITPNDIR
jgi:hypothetical protein